MCGSGARILADFLLHPDCHLTELSLADNPRVGSGGASVGAADGDLGTVADAGTDRSAADAATADEEAGCVALARALRSPALCLKRLNLGGCGVTDAGALHLAAAVGGSAGALPQGGAGRACPALECINLRSNDVADAGATALTSAVRVHGGALTEISLGNNPRVGAVALREMSAVLSRNKRSALVAEIARVAAGAGAGVAGSGAAGKGSAGKGSAGKVGRDEGGRCSLKRRGLDDDDAVAIASFLSRTAPQPQCQDATAAAAATIEITATAVTAAAVHGLDLSDNGIGERGMAVLAAALRGLGGNRSLRAISVAGNPGAGTTAAHALAGCAAANFLRTAGAGEALRSVSDRGLGDAGAAEVAAYIQAEPATSCALTALGMQHNGIGPAGCEALALALGTLPALDELAMYSNGEVPTHVG